MVMNVARIFAVLGVALSTVLATSASAFAATPATWDDPEPVSKLFVLGLVVGAPLALFVGIWVLAALVNLKAKHYSPEIPSAEVDLVSH